MKGYLQDTSTSLEIPGPAGVTQVAVNFGSIPISEQVFTIVDATVTPASKILAEVAYTAPFGKDLDEIEMDDLQIRCGAGAGAFQMYITSANGSYLADQFVINYQVGV